jgi:sortase A
LTSPSTQPAPRRRRSRADSVVRFIGILGRVFVLAGVLLLFFTAYLLWGTGVYTKHQQDRLEKTLAANPTVSEKAVAEGKEIPPARPEKVPSLGAPLFAIKIPKIALDTVVVQGVGVEELKKGPGLFPDCDQVGGDCVNEAKYPGEKGNVAISGHRTTYGAPFFHLEELQKGDVVDFVSGPARYRYRVRSQEIVDPVQGFRVVEQHGKTELTLTTCNPRFSAAQRLIIHADYEGASRVAAASGKGGPAPRDVPVIPQDVLILAAIALAAALGSLALSRRYQRTAAYITVSLVGAVGLWVLAFPQIVQLMPANY